MRRAALALALAARASSDYLLTQFFPGDGGCVGEAQPAEVRNGECIYVPEVDPAKPFSHFQCISPTTYNTSVFSTTLCAGAPTDFVVRQVGGCENAGDLGRGFKNQVCLSETFDPTSRVPELASDQYNILPGSPGAATCPPTIGSGVVFYSRFYTNFALNVCEPAKKGRSNITSQSPNSYIFSCNPYNTNTGRVQGFQTFDCSGPEDPSPYDNAGCAKESETFVTLENPGTQCLSPPASSSSGASLSPAGLIGIGAGIGLTVAALAFAAHAFFRRYRPTGAGAGAGRADIADRARSLPLIAVAAAAAASTPLLASGGGKAARTGGQFTM